MEAFWGKQSSVQPRAILAVGRGLGTRGMGWVVRSSRVAMSVKNKDVFHTVRDPYVEQKELLCAGAFGMVMQHISTEACQIFLRVILKVPKILLLNVIDLLAGSSFGDA